MDWWAIGIGIAGVLSGLAGVVLAYLANQHAKKSNGIAERALEKSAKANSVAVEANQLAQDANTISERALSISGEIFEYEWRLRVEDDGSIKITHRGSHEARNLSLFAEVQSSGKAVFPEARFCLERDHVTFGEELSLDIESIYPELISQARAAEPYILMAFGAGRIYDGRCPIEFDTVIVLTWLSPAGRKCGDVLNHAVSCREDKRGDIIFTVADRHLDSNFCGQSNWPAR